MNENGFNNTQATIKTLPSKRTSRFRPYPRPREADKTPAETVSKVRPPRKRSITSTTRRRVPSPKGARTPSASSCLPRRSAAFGVNLMAIQKTCSERNYSCKVALSQFSPEEERLAMRRFHEQRIGGLILVGLDMSNVEYMKTLEAAGIPASSCGSAGRKRELYQHRQRAVHLYECQIPH